MYLCSAGQLGTQPDNQLCNRMVTIVHALTRCHVSSGRWICSNITSVVSAFPKDANRIISANSLKNDQVLIALLTKSSGRCCVSIHFAMFDCCCQYRK